MFLDHFGLVEQPFGVTPDPRFLHLGRGHREALASLIYGTENNRGFLALVGPPGMGKTSLLFQYLENIRNQARIAFLFQSAGDGEALMRYLLYDLGQDPAGKDLPSMHQALNNVLAEEMRAGRRVVLVLDEAQNMSEEALELARLLSNFETPWMKLLQIIIAGQPQLAERLARPSMEQLRQRISCFIRLEPFQPEETSTYIDHRLWAAGYDGPALFSCGARIAIGGLSGGIPRNINNLCFHAMSLAYAAKTKQVDAAMVREAAKDCAVGSTSACTATAPRRPDTMEMYSRYPVLTAPQAAQRPRWLPAMVLVCTVLFLVVVSGVLWKTGRLTQKLDVTPSVEASVLPAPESPRMPASETAAVREGLGSAADHLGPETFVKATPGNSAIDASGTEVVTAIVEKGTTLRHLSLLYLERYDLPTLARLCALNHISDPNQIEIGQAIRIPLSWRHSIVHPTQTAPTTVPEALP